DDLGVPGGRDHDGDVEGAELLDGRLPHRVAGQDDDVGLELGDRLVVQLVQALGDDRVLVESEIGQSVQGGAVDADDTIGGADGAHELVGVAVDDDGALRGSGQDDLAVLVVGDRQLRGGVLTALDGDLAAGGE